MSKAEADALAFMRGLLDERLGGLPEALAGLTDRERRTARKDPRAFLERLGLKPPPEITVEIMKARRADLGVLDPDGPTTTSLPTCIRLCFPAPTLGLLEPKICYWVCV